MQGIYKIQNTLNGKYYVGSSKHHEGRWREHKRELRVGKHYNPHLQRAWNKYGEESFKLEFVESVGNEDRLLSIEQEYLDEGFGLGLLYNTARTAGGGNLGEEVNRKISIARMGYPSENNPMYGKKGEAHPAYGYRHTEEAKAKISKAKIGTNHPMHGKHLSEEHRTKIGRGLARSYPAFYNPKTDETIPAGCNLKKLCSERNLSYQMVWSLKVGLTKSSKEGWRLANI